MDNKDYLLLPFFFFSNLHYNFILTMLIFLWLCAHANLILLASNLTRFPHPASALSSSKMPKHKT